MEENNNVEEIKVQEIPNPTVPVVQSSVDIWIQSAIDKGLSIDHLERLFKMKKEYDALEAKKAFDEAMMLFQSKCPAIKKTKRGGVTKDGTVAYYFAPIEDIVAQTKDLVAECGFSYLIKAPAFTETSVTISIEVRHVNGHSETSIMTVPLLTKTGVMSEAQVVAGTVTFAKRYAFCNAFGIMTMDDDSDAMDNDFALEELEPLLQVVPEVCQSYLKKITDTIEAKSTFIKWKNALVSIDNVNKMKELASKMPEHLRDKYWLDFIKQNTETVNNWLNNLETALKPKEKK